MMKGFIVSYPKHKPVELTYFDQVHPPPIVRFRRSKRYGGLMSMFDVFGEFCTDEIWKPERLKTYISCKEYGKTLRVVHVMDILCRFFILQANQQWKLAVGQTALGLMSPKKKNNEAVDVYTRKKSEPMKK